jgi:hypothetical protein
MVKDYATLEVVVRDDGSVSIHECAASTYISGTVDELLEYLRKRLTELQGACRGKY